MKRTDRTRRVARLVAVLSRHPKGCTVAQMARTTGASRATVYRDLDVLRDSDYEVHVETINGEARYTLAASALSSQPMTAKERAAIALARRALSSIEGSWIVRELDAVLQRSQAVKPQASRIELTLAPLPYQPTIVRVLHDALSAQRKLRIRYRGARDAAAIDRVVHPIHLQVVDQQPYLVAWDEQKKDRRTFKVARITAAVMLRDKAPPHALEGRDERARPVRVWSSEPFDVRIRIGKDVARFVAEWPLASNQAVEPAARGAVDICARVYGLDETLRWVLRWGRHAEVITPAALRQRAQEELLHALAHYAVHESSHA